MQQADALHMKYQIRQKGEIILTDIRLQDAHLRLQDIPGLRAQDLECIPSPHEGGSDMPQIEGVLMATAARLGLLELVEFLLGSSSKPWGEDLLTAACRGGHMDMLRLLISKGVSALSGPTSDSIPRPTPLHWLGGFSLDEVGIALELLLCIPGSKEYLLQNIPAPGIRVGDCTVSDAPLEVAIATNNIALVHAFLATNLDNAKPQDHPKSIGWTANTYPVAVALNLYHLLPSLFDLEKSYRSSLWTTPSIPPMGLFDLVHSHDALLPPLIHGHAQATALSFTISFILSTGANPSNPPGGMTPLSHAVRHAPCRFGLEPISSLISLGAPFSPTSEDQVLSLTSSVVQRRGGALPSIITHLLSTGILPLSLALLASAIYIGNTAAAAAILDTPVAGRTLDPNDPLVAGDMHIPLLFAAIGMGDISTVRLLLDRGAQLNIRWDDKDPLEAAVATSTCQGEIIDLLIERGAQVEWEEYTILHRAAMGQATVRGVYVLFHLLEHERLRAIVNLSVQGLTALSMAVYAGNVEGVHALLQGGAVVESKGMLEKLVEVAVDSGRRPMKSSPTWSGKERAPDKEELQRWRVGVEEIILALLDRGDPGHGRTRLHIAVQLGNRARVVELVEEQGMRMFLGDRQKLTPGAFLEDLKELEESGEDDEEYLEELKLLQKYIQRKVVEEVIADSTTPEGLERWLGDHPPAPDDSEENKNAIIDLEGTLAKLKLEREETELSGGDGTETVAEREAKLRRAVKLQRQRLGETHLDTLRTMAQLYAALAYQGKYEKAAALHETVLKQRQAQLPPDHVDLFEALIDKVYITNGLGKPLEAHDFPLALSLSAIDTFGNRHPVTIRAETARAGVETVLGNPENAIRIQEEVEKLNDHISRDQAFSETANSGTALDFDESLFYLRANLVFDYCRVKNFAAANELSKSLSYKLFIAKPKDFSSIFDMLVNVAAMLDISGQHSASEPILTDVVRACLETHKKRKSYATRTALERLASHYGQRRMWEKEAKTLQTLVDHLKATLVPDHGDTIKQKRGLSTALTKCGSWAEASLLLEQVLKVLEGQRQQLASRLVSSPGDANTESQPLPQSHDLDLEIAAVKTSLCKTLREQNQFSRAEPTVKTRCSCTKPPLAPPTISLSLPCTIWA